MRVFVVILGLLVVLLQCRLWVSDQGMQEVARLRAALEAQSTANHAQRDRNRQLAAEVDNLKVGFTAIEERARSELGMVGRSETFFQAVKPSLPSTSLPLPLPSIVPGSHPLTARAQ
jgi:cell division protein FtsB